MQREWAAQHTRSRPLRICRTLTLVMRVARSVSGLKAMAMTLRFKAATLSTCHARCNKMQEVRQCAATCESSRTHLPNVLGAFDHDVGQAINPAATYVI